MWQSRSLMTFLVVMTATNVVIIGSPSLWHKTSFWNFTWSNHMTYTQGIDSTILTFHWFPQLGTFWYRLEWLRKMENPRNTLDIDFQLVLKNRKPRVIGPFQNFQIFFHVIILKMISFIWEFNQFRSISTGWNLPRLNF